MRNEKRKQRKADRQRRKKTLAARHAPPTATFTGYGKDGKAYSAGVVVHGDNQVVGSRVLQVKDYPSDRAWLLTAFDFAQRHGAARIAIVEELQPLQNGPSGDAPGRLIEHGLGTGQCSCCGGECEVEVHQARPVTAADVARNE